MQHAQHKKARWTARGRAFASSDEDGQDGICVIRRAGHHVEHVSCSPREEHVLLHAAAARNQLALLLPQLQGELHPPPDLEADADAGQRKRRLLPPLLRSIAHGSRALIITSLRGWSVRCKGFEV